MKPLYTLTAPPGEHNINLATKPTQVEAWLAELRNCGPLEQVDLLATYLGNHDRPDLPAAFRKRLLDLTGRLAGDAMRILESEFMEAALPMNAAEQARVDQAIRLLTAVAAMNKRLVFEFAEYTPHWFGENPLPGFIAGYLHAARKILDLCYLCHRQLPDSLWREIHQTGYLILEARLADVPDPSGGAARLVDVYSAILLEAIADPYQCSGQERLWVGDVIARLGRLARLEYADALGNKGVYGIKVAEDKPPRPLSWRRSPVSSGELALNTSPLVKKLALVISHLEQGEPPGSDMPAVRHPAYRALLQRLKLHWSGSMLRTTQRRRPLRQSRFGMQLGFYAIHARLSGTAEGPFDPIPCQLVNESLGGMAVAVEHPGFHLQMGMLAYVVGEAGDGPGQLGLVRWFKLRPDGTLTLGIKSLLGQPEPVAAHTEDGRHTYPALLMHLEHGRQQDRPERALAKLMLPAVHLEAGGNLEIRRAGAGVRLKLVEKVEGSDDVTLFRCRVESDG